MNKNQLEENFKEFSDLLTSEINESSANIDDMKKLEIIRNVLNILLFVYMLILIGLGFLFYYKKFRISAFVISILLLFTIPVIMFLEANNINYYFIITDMCDSINQSIYNNQIPIYGKGLGWITNCHSSDLRTKGFAYNYNLFNANQEIEKLLGKLKEDEVANNNSISDLQYLQKEILKTKKEYLDPILTCDAMYNNIISLEDVICKNGLSYSKIVFTNYFWLMICMLFVFWGFNRNVLLIERFIYDEKEKLMAEESAY